MSLPGIRRASAAQDVTDTVALKAEFRALCVELGLTLDDGSLCKRGAARYLEEHGYFDDAKPSTFREAIVRGWVNGYALNRRPPEKALQLLRRKVAEHRRFDGVWLGQVASALEAVR